VVKAGEEKEATLNAARASSVDADLSAGNTLQ